MKNKMPVKTWQINWPNLGILVKQCIPCLPKHCLRSLDKKATKELCMAWLKLSYPLSSLSLAWKGIFFVVFILLDIVLSSSFNSTYNKSSLTCRDALLNNKIQQPLYLLRGYDLYGPLTFVCLFFFFGLTVLFSTSALAYLSCSVLLCCLISASSWDIW